MLLSIYLTVAAASGPLAYDVHALVVAMKCMLVPHMFDLDPTSPPIAFRNEVCSRGNRLIVLCVSRDGAFVK